MCRNCERMQCQLDMLEGKVTLLMASLRITKIKPRRDTVANWEKVNPVIAKGEVALIIHPETGQPLTYVIGNGVDKWSDLEVKTYFE